MVDIIMTREPTPLLRACRERGIIAHPGFEMLIQLVPEYCAFRRARIGRSASNRSDRSAPVAAAALTAATCNIHNEHL